MEKKTLGSFLAVLRKANGMTQRELAEKLNVSDKAVSRWERDENAPDLSLIPVIAEIFGITSDELLRGERSVPGENPARAAEKTDKQLRRLLKDTLTKFRMRSCITLGIALVGLIAALIGNTAFQRAYLGFLAACIFFVVAGVCQVIFLVLGFHALDQEEFDPALTADCRKQLVLGSELVAGVIAALFAACLPLTLVPDADCWLSDGWLKLGILFALAAAALLSVIFPLLNLKLGYWSTARFKTPLWKLRFRSLGIALILVLVIGLGQILFGSFLSDHHELLASYEVYDNWEDFKTLMETPTDPRGLPLTFKTSVACLDDHTYYLVYENETGGEYEFHSNEILQSVYQTPEDTEPVIQYRRLNLFVSEIKYSPTDDMLPIYVFDQQDSAQVNQKGNLCMAIYSALYILALGIVLARHIRRKREISRT